MSTSLENTGPTDHSPETDEPGEAVEHDEATEAEAAEESAFMADPRPGGVLSTETFGLVALFLLAITMFSGQLIGLLTTVSSIGDQPVTVAQVAQLNTQITVGGTLAAASALTAALALVLSGTGTRDWARWTASAVLITGLLLVVVAVLTYLQVPAGVAQQPPMMPTG
ncbi:heme/copper-type cytochrome/quinol oxidase subunit 3 [Nocardiopsis arvandica]|uniref:Heme/copper-type cytochrome/quinol oxidase subunit 3 n=1 Tax=Nocardiopsis sinuspersici TaxID=501010 RepID=A0A7Z0BJ39_9ACTN|nr:hypothetical protein [Nocardiopsis sinuspersici]NYH50989.1 heme/copper-type cytochrome/quinol oxidase subunit 3 [Nocardiopsis sinuspersici]